jgi:hypothetical protein
MFAGVFSSSWFVPFHAEPFAFSSFDSAVVADGTEAGVEAEALSYVDIGCHDWLSRSNFPSPLASIAGEQIY